MQSTQCKWKEDLIQDYTLCLQIATSSPLSLGKERQYSVGETSNDTGKIARDQSR